MLLSDRPNLSKDFLAGTAEDDGIRRGWDTSMPRSLRARNNARVGPRCANEVGAARDGRATGTTRC